MPRVEHTVRVPVSAAVAFVLSQTYGELRYAWDPFVRKQRLLDGATAPGRGVRTWTRSRHHLTMVTSYVSWKPPSHVGMKMEQGPPIFRTFSGGWNFLDLGDGTSEVTWRYNFVCRPAWLQWLMHPMGSVVLGRDIRNRLEAFARACADRQILDRLPSPP